MRLSLLGHCATLIAVVALAAEANPPPPTLPLPAEVVSTSSPGSVVLVIRVNAVINAGTARYIARGVELAERKNAELLVVVLDTPGGLLQSTRAIVQSIAASRVPVAVYVSPTGASATSAGAIIAMSAHFAGMAPGTNIGAAHPVGGQGEDVKGAMGEKAVNDTVAFIKSQAALRGRNTEWAEQAIRKSASATSDEALKLKVVDFIAGDLAEALLKIDGRPREQNASAQARALSTVRVAGLPVIEEPMTTAERFLTLIGDPNISYLLMVLGGLGLYVEITSAGTIFPGVFGAICLILAFISFSTLPINYGAVALIFIGLVLFALEVFITSYGLLTVGGIVSLMIGAMLLIDPSTGDLRLSMTLVVPTVAAIGLITAFVGYSIFKSRKFAYGGATSFEGFGGTVQALDASGHAGKCLIRGEVWDFRLAETAKALHVGDHVQVLRREGFKLVVRRESGSQGDSK